jgi:hypothetical protein
LEKNHPATNWWDRLFIHAPFSLWHGFIVFVAVLNAFAAFTTTQEEGPDTLHITLVIFGLVFLTSTAIGYVEYKSAKGDVTGALVIAIGLFGVFAQVRAVTIHVLLLAVGRNLTLKLVATLINFYYYYISFLQYSNKILSSTGLLLPLLSSLSSTPLALTSSSCWAAPPNLERLLLSSVKREVMTFSIVNPFLSFLYLSSRNNRFLFTCTRVSFKAKTVI